MILPDLNAGCSMADMAEISQVEACWEALERARAPGEFDADHLHEFHRGHQGVLRRARRSGLHFVECARGFRVGICAGKRILFLPDQHLGRNTGFAMGIPLDEMAVWDPWASDWHRAGRPRQRSPRAACCFGRAIAPCISVFCRSHVDKVRAKYPGIQVIVHPECRWEVCQKADALGSTERLIAICGGRAGGIDVCHRNRD